MAGSVAPASFRPAFVGGSLGSGLNASLLRKIQILAYWLGIIFPGTTIQYVQGSPSGSSVSGGTHAGPGDAVDLEILVGGRRAPVGVYIIASLILRMLFCLAYVRGQDVNGDGVKDDSFDPHLHAIDREGGGKAIAAVFQIAQFIAHQNGLKGGRADLEATVNNPLALAQYTDDLFRARFMALTPAAAVLAVHTEPAPQEEPMSTFVQVKGDPTVYLTDGITARKVPDEQTLRDLYYLGGLLGIKTPPAGDGVIIVAIDVPVRVVANPAVVGTIVGTVVAPSTTVIANLSDADLGRIADAVRAKIIKEA